MEMTAPCTYCGTPLDPTSRYVWRRIQGWEKKSTGTAGSRRGGSDISCRELLEEVACDQCIMRLKRGVNPVQDSLL